jgi:hypothetical protein
VRLATTATRSGEASETKKGSAARGGNLIDGPDDLNFVDARTSGCTNNADTGETTACVILTSETGREDRGAVDEENDFGGENSGAGANARASP